MSCPACEAKRLHTAEEWKNHPLAGHGYTLETGWTHPEAKRLHELEKQQREKKASGA